MMKPWSFPLDITMLQDSMSSKGGGSSTTMRLDDAICVWVKMPWVFGHVNSTIARVLTLKT